MSSTINPDDYMFDESVLSNSRGGKNRSKTEAALHSNKHDPCGHTRKIVEKFHNSEKNKREAKK